MKKAIPLLFIIILVFSLHAPAYAYFNPEGSSDCIRLAQKAYEKGENYGGYGIIKEIEIFNWLQEVIERFRMDNIEEATRWDKNLLLYQFNQSTYDGSGCQTHMLLIFYPPGEEPTPPNLPPGPPPPPPGTGENDNPVPPPPVDPDPDDHENATPGGGGTIPTPPPTGEAGFSISPTNLTITAGKTQQFTAYYKSALETTRKTVTNSTSWTSSNPAVATINASGLLTAITAGTTTVTGSYSGKTAAAAVTVNTIEQPKPPEYGGDHLAGCGLFLFDEPGGYVNHPVTVGVSLVKNAEEPVSWGDSANGGLITVTYTLLTPSLYYENNGWQEAQAAKTIVTQTWYTIPGESGVDEEGNEWSTPDELVTNPPETTDETITCSHLFNQIDRGAPLIWIYDAANNVGDIDQYIYYKNDDQPPIRINFLIQDQPDTGPQPVGEVISGINRVVLTIYKNGEQINQLDQTLPPGQTSYECSCDLQTRGYYVVTARAIDNTDGHNYSGEIRKIFMVANFDLEDLQFYTRHFDEETKEVYGDIDHLLTPRQKVDFNDTSRTWVYFFQPPEFLDPNWCSDPGPNKRFDRNCPLYMNLGDFPSAFDYVDCYAFTLIPEAVKHQVYWFDGTVPPHERSPKTLPQKKETISYNDPFNMPAASKWIKMHYKLYAGMNFGYFNQWESDWPRKVNLIRDENGNKVTHKSYQFLFTQDLPRPKGAYGPAIDIIEWEDY